MSIRPLGDPWHRRPSVWVGMAIGASVGFSAALAGYAYAGTFVRYLADDFCTAWELWRNGFFGSQVYWYTEWSGRYSSTAAINLAELIGPRIAPLLPTLALGAWLLVTFWTVSQLARVLHLVRRWVVSLLLAPVIIFVCLDSLPNLGQVLYWQTGTLTYVVPLILLTLEIGILVEGARQSPNVARRTIALWSILVAMLAFVAGGFSDTYAPLQVGLFSLALLLIVVGPALHLSQRAGRSLRLLMLAGLLGALLALLVVAAAPGNATRGSFFPPHPDLPHVLAASAMYSLEFVRQWGVAHTIELTISLFFPALIAMLFRRSRSIPDLDPDQSDQRIARWLGLLPFLALLLLMVCFVPAVWTLSSVPPERTLAIPQFVLTCSAIVWGYLVGLVLRKNMAAELPATLSLAVAALAIVVSLLLLGPIRSLRQTIASVPAKSSYAMQWDARDRDLRAARLEGKTEVDLPPMVNLVGLDEVPSETNGRLNHCFASYYGLKSIR